MLCILLGPLAPLEPIRNKRPFFESIYRIEEKEVSSQAPLLSKGYRRSCTCIHVDKFGGLPENTNTFFYHRQLCAKIGDKLSNH